MNISGLRHTPNRVVIVFKKLSGAEDESRTLALLPCGGALPNVAHHALERLGGVPESADATVPAAFV